MKIWHAMITLCLLGHPIIGSNTYSVTEFVQDVVQDYIKPASLKTVIDSAESSYLSAKGITDWQLNMQAMGSHQDRSPSPFLPDHTKTLSAKLGVERTLLLTGGTVSVSLNKQAIIEPPIFFGTAPINDEHSHQHALSIQYTQPLLYGFRGEIQKLSIKTASNNVKKVTLQSNEDLSVQLMRQLMDYVDWTLASEIANLSLARLQLAEESFKQVQNRVKVNVSETIDLLRAEHAMRHAHQNWQISQAHLKSVQLKMMTKLNNPSIRYKTPSYALYEPVYIKDPRYVAVDRLRVIKAIEMDQSILNHRLALNQSKRNGSLNVVGSYDLMGDDPHEATSIELGQHGYRVMVTYHRPLFDTQSIQAVEQTKYDIQRLNMSKQTRIQDAQADMVHLHTLINEYRAILDTGLDQIAISLEQAKVEEQRYLQGRSGIDQYIQSQDNVLASKKSYAQQSAQYHQHALRYLALTNELLSKYEVTPL